MEDADAPKLPGEQRLAHLLGFWTSSKSGVLMACAPSVSATIQFLLHPVSSGILGLTRVPPQSSALRRRRCRPRTRPTSTGKRSSTPATGTQPARAPASAPLAGVLPPSASAHSYSYPPRHSSTNRLPYAPEARLLRASHPHPPPYASRRSRPRRIDTPPDPRSYSPRRTRRPHHRGLRAPSHPRQRPSPCPRARAPRGE
ncbi:hypothetical protein B0H14DRAFT_1490626 [Mycena olivaceomarginata]|nr:hypothetical protein B0H14DRAFT_1490626 [Mycena olivaceomarginata]